MHNHVIVFSTVPDEARGREIGRALVEERLAACVTVSAACRSPKNIESGLIPRQSIASIK